MSVIKMLVLMLSSVMNSMSGFSLSILVMSFGWMLSFNTLMNRENNSPFECEFDQTTLTIK